MKNLNEAVVHLINEDIVNGRKIIENELYVRLGNLLEEKLKDFAPTVFSEGGELSPKQKKIAAKAGNPNKIDAEDFKALRKESCDNCDDLLEEDDFMGDLKKLVESIEEDIGEELTESEIEELANILMEDSDPDEDEEEVEDFEEDLEETE